MIFMKPYCIWYDRKACVQHAAAQPGNPAPSLPCTAATSAFAEGVRSMAPLLVCSACRAVSSTMPRKAAGKHGVAGGIEWVQMQCARLQRVHQWAVVLHSGGWLPHCMQACPSYTVAAPEPGCASRAAGVSYSLTLPASSTAAG